MILLFLKQKPKVRRFFLRLQRMFSRWLTTGTEPYASLMHQEWLTQTIVYFKSGTEQPHAIQK